MNLPTPIAAIDKHRLAALQDGVYAIAMTLLVLELRLPQLPPDPNNALLWGALLAIWPKFLTWLLSFWVLAIVWSGDARALAVYALVDRRLLRLALLRLALVSLLPFTSAFIGEHGDHAAAAAVYAAHLLVLAGAQTLRHDYLRRHPDLAHWADARGAAQAGVQAWGMLVCTAAALALAFVAPGYNMLALLPMLVLSRFQVSR